MPKGAFVCYNAASATSGNSPGAYPLPHSAMKDIPSPKAGFTLIELLLVIGIIAILASIVIVAINPTKQLGDARDAQRRSDVNTLLNAVYQYAIDHNGTLPGNIPTGTAREICRETYAVASCTGEPGVNLRVLSGTYLVSIPTDPRTSTATGTTYFIVRDANNRVTVSAPSVEQSATISVTR